MYGPLLSGLLTMESRPRPAPFLRSPLNNSRVAGENAAKRVIKNVNERNYSGQDVANSGFDAGDGLRFWTRYPEI